MTIRKALIVYFSQSGANGRVGEAISSGLQERGYRVDTWNLKEGDPPDPLNYVLPGIGSPVYYYNVPLNVVHFLERLPSLSGIPAFVFLVHGCQSAFNFDPPSASKFDPPQAVNFSC